MQGQFWVVNSEEKLNNFIGQASKLFKENKYVRFNWKVGKDRSIDQNALSFQLYVDIHRGKPDSYPDVNDARAYCKLHLGVGIRREDEDYNEVYATMIKDRFSYEEKLSLMVEPVDFPVTRKMNKDQFSRYVEAIKREFPDVYFRPFE